MTFARGLRAILRQDPDVVMVGEIRDLETAQIAMQASQTGHLVLSTLHTNPAVGAVTRLRDMGVEPYQISSSLIPSSRSTSGCSFTSALHWLQIRRTRRWAMIRFVDGATGNGSISVSTARFAGVGES